MVTKLCVNASVQTVRFSGPPVFLTGGSYNPAFPGGDESAVSVGPFPRAATERSPLAKSCFPAGYATIIGCECTGLLRPGPVKPGDRSLDVHAHNLVHLRLTAGDGVHA
jgi:hypothetical protein